MAPTMADILHRWGPGSLWTVYTSAGDVDGYVRAESEEAALAAAIEQGSYEECTVAECADDDEDDEEYRAEMRGHAREDVRWLLERLAERDAKAESLRALLLEAGEVVRDVSGRHLPARATGAPAANLHRRIEEALRGPDKEKA